MSVIRVNRSAGRNRVVRVSVTGLHKIAFKFVLEDLNFGQPLARSGAHPTGNQGPRRRTVMMSERFAIHVGSNQSVRIKCLFNRYAANKWRNVAGNLVESAKHDVLA